MLEKCLEKIKMQMDENQLQMSCSKTELILFGSRQQLQGCITTYINVNGDEVGRSSIIKYLGAWMDEQLISHLDCVNSILIGLPDTDYKKLQHVQNIAVKLVMKKAKTDSVTECLRTLYWLLIKYWFKHKIATLVYKSLHQLASQYLQDLIKLEVKNHGRSMRSTNNYKTLCIPRVKRKTFTNRSFIIQGSKLWNKLPKR